MPFNLWKVMCMNVADSGPPSRSPGWWNQRYAEGSTPWDTELVPPELHEVVESGLLRPPGVALDLGCGTGTNTLFMAGLGFVAYGIDVAWLALVQARGKAERAGATAYFCQGDVADLDFLPVPAVFALDMGCLHSLAPADRERYAGSLGRRVQPGGHYLLYGFDEGPAAEGGAMGFAAGEIAGRFAPWFSLVWRRPSWQGDRPVAWYLLQRV
jgi:SAM-dependent methyltransferase